MKFSANRTAILTLDLQNGIFGFAHEAEAVVPNAARAVDFARSKNYLLIHVGLGFSPGHPEVPEGESRFQRAKQNNLFVIGTPSGEFHASIFQPGDLTVYKQRVGAFSENHLHLLLRSRGIENLVFFGISTSGVVLSTLRRAFDLDYRSMVLKDACFDGDPEVHRVLTEKVFTPQAAVLTVDEFIAERGA